MFLFLVVGVVVFRVDLGMDLRAPCALSSGFSGPAGTTEVGQARNSLTAALVGAAVTLLVPTLILFAAFCALWSLKLCVYEH